MTRYIKTVSSTGASSGGSAGLTAADVCNTICTLATQAPTDGTTRIMPGFNEWVVICNCPDWNDCYGCTVEWHIDTSLYRAFKWCYRGIRMCACCYMYMCFGMKGSAGHNCYCYCTNSYCHGCMCGWPVHACCGIQNQGECCMMFSGVCMYCCNGQYDSIFGLEFGVAAPGWKACMCRSHTINYWLNYNKFPVLGYCQLWNGSGCDRQVGHTGQCMCLMWSKEQNTSQYLDTVCMKLYDGPFQSACVAGTYASEGSGQGGVTATGRPCWTFYGIPCDNAPEFGICCMTTS
tara:strand:- start:3674 stop:4543 length:870 start_codon:yes stop_codon:yes gene_type:complete